MWDRGSLQSLNLQGGHDSFQGSIFRKVLNSKCHSNKSSEILFPECDLVRVELELFRFALPSAHHCLGNTFLLLLSLAEQSLLAFVVQQVPYLQQLHDEAGVCILFPKLYPFYPPPDKNIYISPLISNNLLFKRYFRLNFPHFSYIYSVYFCQVLYFFISSFSIFRLHFYLFFSFIFSPRRF